MKTYLHSYLMFCQYYDFKPFPASKSVFLFYLVFLLRSLPSYHSVINYLGITTHINRSFGASLAFLQDCDIYLAKRAIRRILGDCIARKEPNTINILFKSFNHFDYDNPLHVCMRALFLVASFSFLRISNLVPYKLSEFGDPRACYLTPSSVTFTTQGVLLSITHTKTIQFRERVSAIPLPRIPGSPRCPVTALEEYLASVQLPPRSPLFVCNEWGVNRPILAHQYNAFIKALLSAIGLNSVNYSLHSFRRGDATFAFSHEAPTAFIKAQGDWKSDAYLVYLTLSTENKF